MSLTLQENGTNTLIDNLRNERVDAVFIRTPVADPAGLVINPLIEEKMLVALPDGHALASDTDTAVPLKAFAAETFIVYRRPNGQGLYDAIIAACHAAGFSPRVGQEAPRIVATLNLVAAGLGISLVPASLQRMHLDGVVYRRLKGAAQPMAPLRLATRRGEPSAAVRSICRHGQASGENLQRRQ